MCVQLAHYTLLHQQNDEHDGIDVLMVGVIGFVCYFGVVSFHSHLYTGDTEAVLSIMQSKCPFFLPPPEQF